MILYYLKFLRYHPFSLVQPKWFSAGFDDLWMRRIDPGKLVQSFRSIAVRVATENRTNQSLASKPGYGRGLTFPI